MNDDAQELDPNTPMVGPEGVFRRKPKSPEWAAEQMRAVLYQARELAVLHRDELLDKGFDRDNANHLATGALYDIQSAMLGALWPNE
jgi:hypothetical protein